jgi:hypothetical protein
MIQVQNDRFIKNWRKEGEKGRYPRYDEKIRPNFDRDYAIFLAFLDKNHLGALRVNQCEVMYVNHILAGQGWEHYSDVQNLHILAVPGFPPARPGGGLAPGRPFHHSGSGWQAHRSPACRRTAGGQHLR